MNPSLPALKSSRALFALSLALLGPWTGPWALTGAESPDTLGAIARLVPALPASALPADQWQVKDTTPFAVEQVFQVGGNYYARDKEGGRWIVGEARGKVIEVHHRFRSAEELLQAHAYPPLPKAPEGFVLRDVAHLPIQPTRMVRDVSGSKLFLLAGNGDVWCLEPTTGAMRHVLKGSQYLDGKLGDPLFTGMAFDKAGALYLVTNQRHETSPLVTNEITFFRTTATSAAGDPAEPKAWFHTAYPFGVGPYNHGVSHLAFGPDGLLYVASGSRTDGGEKGDKPNYATTGETPLNCSLWRINPKDAEPKIEIFARGLRNAYGFCFTEKGEIFATDNGPDKDPAEELNLVEQGKHYGFPYQYSNWKNKPYTYTPDAPAGLEITHPIANLGPDGGYQGRPRFTFDPHSSPAGIIHLDKQFPVAVWRETLLTVRFGNLLPLARDVGFDLLQIKLQRNDRGVYESRIHTLLAPLSRPIDLVQGLGGRIFIAEWARGTTNGPTPGFATGRVLELAPRP